MATQSESHHTTVTVDPDTLQRIHDNKPYSTMSCDEFISTMLDQWEALEGSKR